MKYLVVALPLLFTACYQERIVTKEVMIPTRCDAKMPVKKYEKTYKGTRNNPDGTITQGYLKFSKDKLIHKENYTIELETTLNYCINGLKETETKK